MKSAKVGNTVKVHYTGKLDNGMVFDSSGERESLEFTIGNGQLIKDFEEAVVGMTVGDMKTIKIATAEAYGVHRSELVINIDKSQFPDNIDPKEGLQLDLSNPDGNDLKAIITSVGEDSVTLDANHPLAGEDLTFDIELMEII